MKRARLIADEGAALVLVLFFIAVVGLFATVALNKSVATALSVTAVRGRGSVQFALDGGVDRSIQLLKTDLSARSPTLCTSAGSTSALGTFVLNSYTVNLSCTNEAGRTPTSTSEEPSSSYALIVTSPNAGALTSNAGSGNLTIAGSVFINGKEVNADLSRPAEITQGDLVSPNATTCAALPGGLSLLAVDSPGKRICTSATVASILPDLNLPTAPTVDLTTSGLGAGLIDPKVPTCQIFYPGLYTQAPALTTLDSYFVSGTYYFKNTGPWTVNNGKQIIAGQLGDRRDVTPPSTGCSAVNDVSAGKLLTALQKSWLTTLPYGATWVFGGTSSISLQSGGLTMLTPTYTAPAPPVNLVGADASTASAGYSTAIPTGSTVLDGAISGDATEYFNAMVFSTTGKVTLLASDNATPPIRATVVGYTVKFGSSTSGGTQGLVGGAGITVNPLPPYRTVKVAATDSTGKISNTAVATLSNYPPYTVHVLSWRTD